MIDMAVVLVPSYHPYACKLRRKGASRSLTHGVLAINAAPYRYYFHRVTNTHLGMCVLRPPQPQEKKLLGITIRHGYLFLFNALLNNIITITYTYFFT